MEELKQIKGLVGLGKLMEAFTAFSKTEQGKNLQDEILILSSRHDKNERNKIKGILSHQEYNLEFNNIQNDLLNLINNNLGPSVSESTNLASPSFSSNLDNHQTNNGDRKIKRIQTIIAIITGLITIITIIYQIIITVSSKELTVFLNTPSKSNNVSIDESILILHSPKLEDSILSQVQKNGRVDFCIPYKFRKYTFNFKLKSDNYSILFPDSLFTYSTSEIHVQLVEVKVIESDTSNKNSNSISKIKENVNSSRISDQSKISEITKDSFQLNDSILLNHEEEIDKKNEEAISKIRISIISSKKMGKIIIDDETIELNGNYFFKKNLEIKGQSISVLDIYGNMLKKDIILGKNDTTIKIK